MQKNLKKILCLMLTMAMVLGMIPFSAFASEAQSTSDLPTTMAGLSIAYPYNTEAVQLTGTPADRFDALTFESARGEVESAQLILTPSFAVESFELTMHGLRSENGNIIPGWAFDVYTQHCFTRCFDLLRNSPHSSIHIHFGVELLVLSALLTAAKK